MAGSPPQPARPPTLPLLPLVLLLAVLAPWPQGRHPAAAAAALAEPQCPQTCACRSGLDPLLQRRAKAVTCTGVTQMDLQAVANLSPAVEVLRLTNTTVRRLELFSLRRLPGLVALDLRAVGVQEVEGTGKTLPKLRYFDLSGNNLHALRSFAFRDFPELAHLNLSGNGLRTVLQSALVLPALVVLDLRHNRLETLNPHYFAGMPKLRELYLGHNALSVVPGYVFTKNLDVLDLSHNHIARLDDGAFEAINVSVELSLAGNALRRVPNAPLKRLAYLRRLVLDANAFAALAAGAVAGLSVRSLSVSRQRALRLVHRDAFRNLLELEELQIRGNPALTYLHPQSLVNVPRLRALDLSNNALFTLEPELLRSAPAVADLRVTNNSFACHCSLLWLRDRTEEEVLCAESANASLTPLARLSGPADECTPSILPLFPTFYRQSLGNNASFHCRALGSPGLKVYWTSKSGERLRDGCVGRLCVLDHTLTIRYLHHEDSGSYTCVAKNSAGVDTRVVTLEVLDVNMNLFPMTVTSTFVTLTWNMSASISNNYMLRYEEVQESGSSEPRSVTFSVGMKIHSYTVNGLRPGVTYDFSLCIEREQYVIVISTARVTTREQDFLLTLGIQRNYLSAVLVSVAVGVLLAACLGFCGFRCWRQRSKLQREPAARRRLAKSDSAFSGRSMLPSSSTHSDMAFITYINLADDGLLADHSTESNLMGYA